MKSLFAYNFNNTKMEKPEVTNKPTFGGPNSAFSSYKVHDEAAIPEIRYERKNAFRRLKLLFGMSEPVGISSSNKSICTSQK